MIRMLIEFSAKNRTLVLFLTGILCICGWFSLRSIPIDAIPDLSDTQVIVYSKWDRSPDVIEDQVTYPIVSALLGAPKVKDIRGFSDFGYSTVYVIFEEGTDLYWARSRVVEYLSKVTAQLPVGAKTELGPDATGVGWVYQYALVDRTGQHSLEELRTLQDWNLRFVLQSVPGVAEVAALGGFQKQYQIQLNPSALFNRHIAIEQVARAIREGNQESGARVFEVAGAEYMIRGRGYVKNPGDLGRIVVGEANGVPIYVRDIARVTVGPDLRRGIGDLDGEGDAVSGIIVMRNGENASKVIAAVKKRIDEIRPSLPAGVEIVPVYDRSDLVHRAIDTLKHELIIEMIIVSLVIFAFLLHIPSALIPVVTLPVAVLLSFIPMLFMGVSSNVMSLGGIAIAIGAMVDAAVVVVENVHKRMSERDTSVSQDHQAESTDRVIIDAILEVAPSGFYSLLIIAVAFLPIFALEAQEGKLFKPLAYTKNLSIFVAALLSITLDPALRLWLTRFRLWPKDYTWLKFRIPKIVIRVRNSIFVGKHMTEDQHPVSHVLQKVYSPVVNWAVDHRTQVVAGALVLFLVTIPVFFRLGSEFMPPLNEGSILFMPTTMPGISVTEAQNLLQKQDVILKSFPEVERVYGKAGRADTATDPAPLSMFETVVTLKPASQWRSGMSWEKLIETMNSQLNFAGTTNAFTMPIKNRIEMLATGIRTPLGLKLQGSDLAVLQKLGEQIEGVFKGIPGIRSVFAERVSEGYFLDVKFDRERLARYSISLAAAQEALSLSIGGEEVTRTVEGRARYSVNIRYGKDHRATVDDLKKVWLTSTSGALIPLGQVAELEFTTGPAMIRDENGLLTSYVFIDTNNSDLGGIVSRAQETLRQKIELPLGVSVKFSGQYESMQRVGDRLLWVIPLTLLLISFLLYLSTKSALKTALVLLAVPFSAIGAVWFLWALGYHLSVAVWVGLIALLGVDAETGVFMLLYLDLSVNRAQKEGRLVTDADWREAIHDGAVKRIRPKVMTVACLMMGLLPILFFASNRAGADVMKRIAAPMVGGIFTSFLLELLVYPAVYRLLFGKKIQKLTVS